MLQGLRWKRSISPSAGSLAATPRAPSSYGSVLSFCAGLLFSTRVILAMISARWLNIGSEPGVLAGFFFAILIAFLALMNGFGKVSRPAARALSVRPVRWVLFYLAFSGCSLLWSAANSTVASATYWCALVVDVVIVLSLAHGSDGSLIGHSLLKGFIAGTCVLAVFAWIMPASADFRLGDVDYFNTNQIGNACAFSVLMCSLLASRGDRVRAFVSWFLTVTLFRSLSKATLIAFAAGAVYRLFWDCSISKARKWAFSAAALVLAIGFWIPFGEYLDFYASTGNQAETLTGRTAIWAWALEAARDKPWIGNGFDAMWKVAPPFGNELFEARHAENELLQQFFSYGICGILMLAGIYGSLYRLIRKLPEIGEKCASIAFVVFVLIRGFAEAEPFDLLLPLWLIVTLSVLPRTEIQSDLAPETLSSTNEIVSTLPA